MAKLLKPEEMAERLSIAPRTLRQWQADRIVPFIKIRQTVLFDPGKVMEALEKFERKATV